MKTADVPAGRRELSRGHVAFYRAVMEGVDPKAAWDRYCALDGDYTEALSEATLSWVRQELIAECMAIGQPGLIGLLRRDPRRIPRSQTPTLEEFARRFEDAGDFSEEELLELWKDEFGGGSKDEQRRDRLARRLRDALSLLEKAERRSPSPSDAVQRWLAPGLARRLLDAGIETLEQAAASLARKRTARWQEVPGVGEVWAERLKSWLEEAGIRPPPAEPEVVREIVPLELMPPEGPVRATGAMLGAPPPPLPSPAGIAGVTDRALAQNQIGALDDRHAVELWLAARAGNSNTLRAYRRVAERLLLWCRYERQVGLAAMQVSDCIHYRTWLSTLGRQDPDQWRQAGWRIPADQWIGRRAARRDSPDWRPFDGPLSQRSVEQELLIVKALFTFLLKGGYITHHPWELLGKTPRTAAKLTDAAEQFVERSIDRKQWEWILAGVDSPSPAAEGESDDLRLRMKAVLWLGFGCGLRASEMLGLTLASLIPRSSGWRLRVLGKGSKVRTIPLPSPARDAVLEYLASVGLDLESVSRLAQEGSELPVLRAQRGRRSVGRQAPSDPMSYSALYNSLKRYLKDRASDLARTDPVSAAKLRSASTHWLRHTCGTLALEAGVPLNAVQRVLGHSDLRTTSGYVTAEVEAAQAAMESFAVGAAK